ncbi:M-phase inducer phosphatase [Ceraceosorus bombacis]|uniref:M-phase inducer phosphatase n=1 Tax=Ceraceosorus bombacis TaxID=401625 RepID=A0A0P1BBG7_9BASI|nr:M-phase inducer phosphatase [Ceraceosorus bombacis]
MWITASELAERLTRASAGQLHASDPQSSTAIIDVRDDDFEGGNIVGCKNVPSRIYRDSVKGVVRDVEQYPLVVFHCQLSQSRGPTAARLYIDERVSQLEAGKLKPLREPRESDDEIGKCIEGGQEIRILRGGFSSFGEQYKANPKLVENWDQESQDYR